ncbi:MAG: UDP-3-O-acyl-N-acetylglucosamine deacetylase [Acidobacteriota bacterium]|nr:UDP-3-O-acyl-N-acetylglucosamine deacetylase [Acidobacteriota bacterium]
MTRKQTLAKEVRFSGVGIHSGKSVNLSLLPSLAGEIVFRRRDLNGLEISLDPENKGAENCSYLASAEGRIQTVEHLLAALSACGVDSLVAEVDGPEIPILDGSALPFVTAIRAAGRAALPHEKKILRVIKPFRLEDKDASIAVEPAPEFRVSYGIEFDHPAIGRQEIDIRVTEDSFVREIAPARTFGFLRDVPELRRRGLALGGSLDNALVLDDEKVMNGPLRFPDEYVRHKVGDFIGDLYFLGCPVLGRFRAHKAGHRLHLETVDFLLRRPDVRAF